MGFCYGHQRVVATAGPFPGTAGKTQTRVASSASTPWGPATGERLSSKLSSTGAKWHLPLCG